MIHFNCAMQPTIIRFYNTSAAYFFYLHSAETASLFKPSLNPFIAISFSLFDLPLPSDKPI